MKAVFGAAAGLLTIAIVSYLQAGTIGGSTAWGVLYCIPVCLAAIYVGVAAGLVTAVVCSLLYWLLPTGADAARDAVVLIASPIGFGIVGLAAGRVTAGRARRIACCTCLADVAKAVTKSADLPEVLNSMVEKTVWALGGKGALMRLLDESGEKLQSTASYGLSKEYLEKGEVSVKASVIDQEALRGKTVISSNVQKDKRFQYQMELQREGLGSMISAPIVVGEKPRGILRLYRPSPGGFDQQDRWLMETLTELAGLAITRALVHEGLKADKEGLNKCLREMSWH